MKSIKLIAVCMIFLCPLGTIAQESTAIVSFIESTFEIMGSDDQVKDLNNTICALVKVRVLDDITDVDGNQMGSIVNRGAEKWVYMAAGSKDMTIHLKNNMPVTIIFSDWGYASLKSNTVYVLTLSTPVAQSKEMQNTAEPHKTQFMYYKDSIYVKQDKNWFCLTGNFNLPDIKQLQELFCSYLFHSKGKSLEDLFNRHIRNYADLRSPEYYSGITNNKILYSVQSYVTKEPRYLNLTATYNRTYYEKKHEKRMENNYSVIYDTERNEMLDLSDVFTPSTVKELEKEMGTLLSYGLSMNNLGVTIDFYKKEKDVPFGKAIEEKRRSYNFVFDNKLFNNSFLNTLTFISDLAESNPQSKVGNQNPLQGHSQTSIQKDTTIYDIVEEMPTFYNGGYPAFQKWISECMTYPNQAQDFGLNGRVICTFIVEPDGAISNVDIAVPLQSAIDKEVVKVLEKMPKWNPGRKDGVPVRVRLYLPINFELK